METADFTESILKEIFRKHVLASRSSHLEVFCENYAANFFLKHYLRFKQIHLKIPADVVLHFLITLVAPCNLLQLVAIRCNLSIFPVTSCTITSSGTFTASL